MLGTAPKTGTNTILITHKPNIVDALGQDWFDVKEGEASLFRPENGSYKLLARVQMDEWPRRRKQDPWAGQRRATVSTKRGLSTESPSASRIVLFALLRP